MYMYRKDLGTTKQQGRKIPAEVIRARQTQTSRPWATDKDD